ncbi:MAG: FAD-dependent oxidoreductase, partial [Pseudomonadota bacterium]
MRVAVIGAGIVGVTTAYELAQDGHAVTVIERHSSVAAEASFAPGGLMGAGSVAPWGWAGGGWWSRLSLDPQQWRWLWRKPRGATGAVPPQALVALARHSQQRLTELRAHLRVEYERTEGLLVLLRNARELADAQASLTLLRELGCAVRELDAAACHVREPGLNRDQPIAAGLLLRDAAERAGTEFRFGTVARALDADGSGCRLRLEQHALSTGLPGSQLAAPAQAGVPTRIARRARAAARYLDPVSEESFDAVVIAAGADAVDWFAALGLSLPLLPIHGCSLTAPLRSPERGPRHAVLQAHGGLAISRLGQRVRVAGGVQLGGSAQRQRRAEIEALYKALNDWFPGGAHLARPQLWKGARPSLPHGLPLIGPSPRPGVWLNLGHGGSGWALACGSARLL